MVRSGHGMETQYTLDSTSSSARHKPLSYILAKILAHQRHPVYAEWAEGRWGIEEPGDYLDVGRVVGGVHRLGRATPVLMGMKT